MKTATIKIHGKDCSAEGETVTEALENLSFQGFSRTQSRLTVGEKTIVLYPQQTFRLFSLNPMMRSIAIKQTALRFD